MDGGLKIGRVFQFVLLCASVALVMAGCATTAYYRSEIDGMKAALAEARTAGAEARAPEEYAAAEACLDWLTHEATEFNPFADPRTLSVRDRCRVAFAALRGRIGAAPVAAAEEKASPLQDVFFDFNKWSIRADAKKSLIENVRWLKANPKASITIEGHCDERGTQEYNLGLGQRRAKSAKNYLVAAGINAKRIKVISYGKERPFAPGHDESAWKWNRRAHFVLQ